MKTDKHTKNVVREKMFIDIYKAGHVADKMLGLCGLQRKEMIEDCAELLVQAKRVHDRHIIDSTCDGASAMLNVCDAALKSVIVNVLIGAAYAINTINNESEDKDVNR